MHRISLLLVTLALVACSSTREASEDEGSYRVTENADGSVNIEVSEGASGETLIAALTEAADRIPWTPPESAGGLTQSDDRDLGPGGHAYRYDLAGGRFDVFVYQHDGDVAQQVLETRTALDQLVDAGRIDSYEIADQSKRSVPWEGGKTTLHLLVLSEVEGGEPWDSYMYLLEDGAYWVKIRASYPEGRYTPTELDALVQALLTAE